MKRIVVLLLAVIGCTFISCDNDEWGNGDPAMEHIYYFGFENWGEAASGTFNKNAVVYDVMQGNILEIPVQFHSERVRSYDITVYYYVSNATGDLVRGTDYEIVDANGATLTPDANGAFTMEFPQAKKGVKNIYVKALNASKGSFSVWTFNPNAGEIKHPENITNSQTKNYEVRSFLQNHRVKVNVK